MSNLILLRDLTKMLSMYPRVLHVNAFETHANLSKQLGELIKDIDKRVNDNSEDFGLKSCDDVIRTVGRELMTLMQDPAMALEMQHYWGHIRDNKTDKIPAGPYMQKEEGWLGIFDAYEKALRALSATSLKDDAWDEIGIKIVTAFAQHDGIRDFVPTKKELNDLQNTEDSIRTSAGIPVTNDQHLIGARIGAIRGDDAGEDEIPENEKKDTLKETIKGTIKGDFWQVVTTKVKPSLDLIVAYPGPHSVAQAVLSCFPDKLAEAVIKINDGKNSTNNLHFRYLFGLMNFMFPKNIRSSKEFILFRNKLAGATLNRPLDPEFRNATERLVRTHFDVASRKTMRAIAYAVNLMVLAERFFNYSEHPEKFHWYDTLALAGSTVYAVMACMKLISPKNSVNIADLFMQKIMFGYYHSLSPEDFTKLRDKSNMWKFWSKRADVLQFGLGFLAMISLYEQIGEDAAKNKSVVRDQMDFAAVSALTVGSLMAQFEKLMLKQMWKNIALFGIRGGGWGSLGLFFYDLVEESMTPKLVKIFDKVWYKRFKDNRVSKIYSYLPTLHGRINQIDALYKKSYLDTMSWRAVIPLYTLLFKLDQDEKTKQKNLQAIEQLVHISAMPVDDKTTYDFEMLVRDMKKYRNDFNALQKGPNIPLNTQAWDAIIGEYEQILSSISTPKTSKDIEFKKRLESEPQMNVKNIIDFYRNAKDHPENVYPSGMRGEEIATLMQQGNYTPMLGYLDDPKWENFIYLLPKNAKGYFF